MSKPEIEISVLSDSEQWASSHNTDKYLVSENLHAALCDGVKPYNIERDFTQGKDWIKIEDTELSIKYDKESLEDNLDLKITPLEFDALQLELDCSEYLVDWLNEYLRDSLEQLRINETERMEKLADNCRAFGDC